MTYSYNRRLQLNSRQPPWYSCALLAQAGSSPRGLQIPRYAFAAEVIAMERWDVSRGCSARRHSLPRRTAFLQISLEDSAALAESRTVPGIYWLKAASGPVTKATDAYPCAFLIQSHNAALYLSVCLQKSIIPQNKNPQT